MTKIIELKEGESICFYYDGALTFCACKSLSDVKKEFEIELELEGCNFYVNKSYVGRIVCQGYRIFSKNADMVHSEGKTSKWVEQLK